MQKVFLDDRSIINTNIDRHPFEARVPPIKRDARGTYTQLRHGVSIGAVSCDSA